METVDTREEMRAGVYEKGCRQNEAHCKVKELPIYHMFIYSTLRKKNPP